MTTNASVPDLRPTELLLDGVDVFFDDHGRHEIILVVRQPLIFQQQKTSFLQQTITFKYYTFCFRFLIFCFLGLL